MILFDILWNLFRKSLGNSAYKFLKKSPFGRPYNYYSISTYKNIFDHYKSNGGVVFTSKNILEIGCGEQFFTACLFLKDGAETISLVDPIFTANSASVKESHIKEVEIDSNSSLPSAREKIRYYSSLDSIANDFNGKFDFICSHFVLEHFKDLNNYFQNIRRLLSPQGVSYNFVDLSDHAFHLFDSRLLTKWIYRKNMLYHLKYSDSIYNFITDSRIWVNRLLLPSYKKLAKEYGLSVINVNPSPYKKVKVHKDVLQRNVTSNENELYVSHFSILLKTDV